MTSSVSSDADAARPQRRGEDPAADVEAAAERRPAGIDRASCGRASLEQHRLALPDVEDRQPKQPFGPVAASDAGEIGSAANDDECRDEHDDAATRAVGPRPATATVSAA